MSSASSANLELVRSICAAWERGDWHSVEWAHPEIEFVIADGPDPSRWAGLPAVSEGWRDFLSAWKGYRGEAQEYREIDNEQVYVRLRVSGRGSASGLQMGHMAANVFTLRCGKVRRLDIYWDSENALADLGLAPDSGSPSAPERDR
jgi:ketosteroid isomerase-like protein